MHAPNLTSRRDPDIPPLIGSFSSLGSRTESILSGTSSILPGFDDIQQEELVELPRPSDLSEEWAQMITKSGRIFYLKFASHKVPLSENNAKSWTMCLY